MKKILIILTNESEKNKIENNYLFNAYYRNEQIEVSNIFYKNLDLIDLTSFDDLYFNLVFIDSEKTIKRDIKIYKYFINKLGSSWKENFNNVFFLDIRIINLEKKDNEYYTQYLNILLFEKLPSSKFYLGSYPENFISYQNKEEEILNKIKEGLENKIQKEIKIKEDKTNILSNIKTNIKLIFKEDISYNCLLLIKLIYSENRNSINFNNSILKKENLIEYIKNYIGTGNLFKDYKLRNSAGFFGYSYYSAKHTKLYKSMIENKYIIQNENEEILLSEEGEKIFNKIDFNMDIDFIFYLKKYLKGSKKKSSEEIMSMIFGERSNF